MKIKVNLIRKQEDKSGNETINSQPVIREYQSKRITGTKSTPGESGIYGKVAVGPTRPVNSKYDKDEPYVPLKASFVLKRLDDNKEITRFSSDINGEFKVSVLPGKYIIEPLFVDNKQWPRPDSPFMIVVKPDSYVEIKN